MLGVPAGHSSIVVACSGGPDSVAALALVRAARPAAKLFACYVDHGARPARSIARDVAAVRKAARAVRASVAVVRMPKSASAGESPEASMRVRRYALLTQYARSVGARCVVTGHQRDDVAESILLALARGSGVDGLAAMLPRRPLAPDVMLVRPLLWASKSGLEAYVRDARLPYSVDETNADPRYRRNAIRDVLRRLEAIAPGAAIAFARSAAVVAVDKALLDTLTDAAWRKSMIEGSEGLSARALRALPAGLLERVIRRAVRHAAGDARDFTYEHCAAIARAVRTGSGGSYHAGRVRVMLSAGRLDVTLPPAAALEPRTAKSRAVVAPRTHSQVDWPGGVIDFERLAAAQATRRRRTAIRSFPRAVHLNAKRFAVGVRCTLRAPARGDRFAPQGRGSATPLARFLAKEGVPKERRQSVPLLCIDDTIAAVVGVRAGAGFAAAPGGPALEVRWTPTKVDRHRATADE
ncbi:MAG TPA: tRNA lysidine(34) synthetase TilS [Candidatus Eremiobacteraceae bacterium]|nr:tRNA lysidine(34) synthetase TilS [Candidatus Eremiobacteraceae bacterium]